MKAWLPEAKGRLVKIIAMLLQHLPPDYDYKVIFVRRDIREVLASQRQMLIRRGEATDKVSDDEMAALYEGHLRRVENWLGSQPAFKVLYVNHRDILTNRNKAGGEINKFLGSHLDAKKWLRSWMPLFTGSGKNRPLRPSGLFKTGRTGYL